MAAETSARIASADLVWLCRRLTYALQADEAVVPALDCLAREGPPSVARAAQAMRRRAATGDRMGRGLADAGVPAYIWGSLLSAEQQGDPVKALTRIADRLELEQSLAHPADASIHAYAVGLGRLGLMLAIGVPVLTAVEAVAEGLPEAAVRDAFAGARRPIREGAELSDALAGNARDLPPLTLEMIRDAERDSRLAEALPVIADYLLDVAQHAARQRHNASPKQEAHNG